MLILSTTSVDSSKFQSCPHVYFLSRGVQPGMFTKEKG